MAHEFIGKMPRQKYSEMDSRTATNGNTMETITREFAWVMRKDHVRQKKVDVEWLGIFGCLGLWSDSERIAYWKKDLEGTYWLPPEDED